MSTPHDLARLSSGAPADTGPDAGPGRQPDPSAGPGRQPDPSAGPGPQPDPSAGPGPRSGQQPDPSRQPGPGRQPDPGPDARPGRRVLVIGATGYIGSRLVPRLLADGAEVSVLARTPKRLDDVPWRESVTIHEGGLGDTDALLAALRGVDVACHLVHSMGDSEDFAREERETSVEFVRSAEQAGIERIVHLSGLHPEDEADLSPHLRSRAEVARIMLDSSVPALVIRAGVVIGSGSASFEMIRHLTTRLPAMVTPKWVIHNSIQPIAVRDVVHYLAAATTSPATGGRAVDVGGPDVLEYGQMMQVYAEEAGLRRRLMVPVPVLSPELTAMWTGIVTPMKRGLAGPLVESLRCDAVVGVDDADEVLGAPPGGRTSYRQALREALRIPHGPARPPLWAGADPLDDPARLLPSDPDWAGVRPPTLGRAYPAMSDQRAAPASPTHRYLRALRTGEMETGPLRPSRRRVLVVVVTLVVGAAVNAWALRIPAGDPLFSPATAVLAAVWLGGAFASGPIRAGREPYRPGRPVLSSALIAAALAALFCLGALVVARFEPLREPVDALLAHATVGNLALVALLTAVNGVAEECFHRGAVYSTVARTRPILVTTVVYAAVTATTGIPLLVLAAVLLGLVTAVQRRVTGGVLGPALTHVAWSMVMVFALGPILDAARA